MNHIDGLNQIDPYVRWVKIQKSKSLDGNFVDFDNVFTFISSGIATFVLDGHQYTVKEGDVVMIPPGVRHIITSDMQRTFSEYIFHFDLYTESARTAKVFRGHISEQTKRVITKEESFLRSFPMVIHPTSIVSNEIRAFFLKMHKEYTEQRHGFQGMLSAHAKIMLINLYRCVENDSTPVSEGMISSWNSIQRIVENIQLNYNDPRLSIAMLADLAGYTPNYISTMIKENLGVTIHEYITHVRIDMAKQFLYETDRNITQIAELVGYSSVYSFSRVFKKVVGVTPSQYAHNFLMNIENKNC